MAKGPYSDDKGKYVIVEKGDNLSSICARKDVLNDGSKATYEKVAAMNGISNADYIVVGQKIYFKINSSSGGSSSTSSTSNSASQDLKILDLGELSNTEGVLFAAWSCGLSNIDHYEYKWFYATGDGYGFIGEEGSTNYKNCQYTIPKQAYKVTIKVKPVSKTYGEKNDKVHWTKDWVQKEYYCHDNIVGEVGAPTLEIDKLKLTATLEDVDIDALNATGIEFQIMVNKTSALYTGKRTPRSDERTVMFAQTVSEGGTYRARCRAYRTWGGKDYYGEWSGYSNEVSSSPKTPTITSLTVVEETANETDQEVCIKWSSVSGTSLTGYEVEHTTNKRYFDTASGAETKTVDASSKTELYWGGLAAGETHYFRVRAANGDSYSNWSAVKSIKLGVAPSAPTTWSSSTKVLLGEDLTLNLYWVHNSEDDSNQKEAEIRLYRDNVLTTIKISGNSIVTPVAGISYVYPTNLKEGDAATYYLTINTSVWLTGVSELKWDVRTKGWSADFSERSTPRIVEVAQPVTLTMGIYKGNTKISTVREFPFQLTAYATGGNAIGYHVQITSNSDYETIDNIGNNKIVSKGDVIYSKYIDDVSNNGIGVVFSANNIDLMDGASYTYIVTVSMDTGRSKSLDDRFSVSWDEPYCIPSADITIDKQKLVAYIKPYAENYTYECFLVNKSGNKYTATNTSVNIVGGRELEGIFTTGLNGKQVCEGVKDDGTSLVCYYEKRTGVLRSGTLLSVYRREYDGSFTEIAVDIENSKNVTVTDPHPALDYARYRIVAKDAATGAISYYDMPGVPVDEHAVVIQWGDNWSIFEDTYEDLETGEIKSIADDPMHAWNGTMLKLPYNIDVAPKINKEVSLVNYIGRKQPVVYYGTYLNETATWNVEIPKQNTATLYALRKLAIWMDRVYVREPSGTGYWADISVTFPQKHCEVTIPVTFDIARVEGGA